MNQHPVPQQISSYEFKLVGDMTLKQFVQLAVGIAIAFLFYVLPIPGLLKWPLVTISALSGVGFAFLPVQDRSLSSWLLLFFKACYSPTYYSWKKGTAQDIYRKEVVVSTAAFIATGSVQQAEAYLSSVPVPSEISSAEEYEQSFLRKVLNFFQFAGGGSQQSAQTQMPTTPAVTPITSQDAPSVAPNLVPKPTPPPPPPEHYRGEKVAPVFGNEAAKSHAGAAVFAPEAAPPAPPERPNTVVGQVLTNEGKIVESAILEIREVGGPPVRALKTNKVGHFLTVTPLKDGEYEVETEKDGLSFDVFKFKTTGKIIEPILIVSKKGIEPSS